MAIVWTEELATGSQKIDAQHKMIFSRVNDMFEACSQGKGRQKLDELVNFLADYVVSHFSSEERYMRMHNDANYAAHKAQHEEFMKQLEILKHKIGSEGIGVHTVIATNQLVVTWLTNHIRKVDTQLGTF